MMKSENRQACPRRPSGVRCTRGCSLESFAVQLFSVCTAILIVVFCSTFSVINPTQVGADPARSPTSSTAECAFVVTTDYFSAAYYSTIEVLPPRATNVNIAPVSTDPVAHYDGSEHMVFVINRYLADNIQVVDPDLGFQTIEQYSVGNGSNPHDIRLASGDKAYVSRFEWKTLLIVNPYTGDSLGVVDLSIFADEDGIPEMDRMEIVDGKLFVTLNCIDHTTWQPSGLGKVAVVDVATDTLIDCDPLVPGIQPIVLNLPNPCSELRYDHCWDELVVGCLGSWGTLDGGIEAIDPAGLKSNGVIISEAEIGGDVTDGLLGPGRIGYAVVLEPVPPPDNLARLVAFDRVGREPTDTLYQQTSGSSPSLGTIELNRQCEVYLCDRDVISPGVRIFDIIADTMITKVDVGLPPFDVEFVQQPPAGVRDDEPGSNHECVNRCRLSQNHPNPFSGSTDIAFSISPETGMLPVTLAIYDVHGRLVHSLIDGLWPAGTYSITWDGRDRYGRMVASGVYFCALSSQGRVQTKQVVLTR
jgi:hypothetical protein